MEVSIPYNGGLTAEQFLFYEMRTVAKLYLQGLSVNEIVNVVKRDNLFQYPTEREISRLTRACVKRLESLSNEKLVYELINAPSSVAKQINLYAMMCYNRLVREFMINVIGEKYRCQDFSFSRKDLNIFFSHLQEQNAEIATWSDKTIVKLKQVLTKCLMNVEMIDKAGDTKLNPILISEELENGIRENKDLVSLVAFNCFR
jgi:hypothetical protein